MSRLLALVVFLFFAGAAQAQFRLPNLDLNRALDSAKNLGKATREINQDEEIAIGRDLAATLVGAAPLVADAKVQRYVNNVGRWIASQSERPDLPWQFGVLDAPQLNALAVPGGTIFITRGLLERMQSESELAGVLGHEIGHVVARHGAEHIAKQQLTQGLTGAAVLATYDPNDPSTQRSAAVAAMIGQLVTMRFGRQDELESDALGVRFTSEAGYDPNSMIRLMEILEESSPGQRQPEFFSTHPDPGNRLQQIDAEIQQMFPQGVPSNLTRGDDARFAALKAKL